MIHSQKTRLGVGVGVVFIWAAAGISVSSNRARPAPTGGQITQGASLSADLEGLTAEDLASREEAAEAIRTAHKELVLHLIDVAKQPGQVIDERDTAGRVYVWHESKHLAILLLGDLRSSASVPVLLDNVAYRNPRRMIEKLVGKENSYPAAEALTKIGMPAVEPTIEKLVSQSPKNHTGVLYCWVLREILGVKLGRARLLMAIEETRNPTAKENLEAVLPYFGTPDEAALWERAIEGWDR